MKEETDTSSFLKYFPFGEVTVEPWPETIVTQARELSIDITTPR